MIFSGTQATGEKIKIHGNVLKWKLMRKCELNPKRRQKIKKKSTSNRIQKHRLPHTYLTPTLNTFKDFLTTSTWPAWSQWTATLSLPGGRCQEGWHPTHGSLQTPDWTLSHQIWPVAFTGVGYWEGESWFCAVAMTVSYSHSWVGGSIRLWEGKAWGHWSNKA